MVDRGSIVAPKPFVAIAKRLTAMLSAAALAEPAKLNKG
jgi:hypothetical protein